VTTSPRATSLSVPPGRVFGLVAGLLGVWVAAVVVGRVSHPAGAVVGIAGAVGVLAFHGRAWILSALREAGMLADPVLWGVAVVAAAPFFPGRLGPNVFGVSVDDLPLFVGTVLVAVGVWRVEGLRRLFAPVAWPLYGFALWSAVALVSHGDAAAGGRALVRWGVIAVLFAGVVVVARRPGYGRVVVGAVLLFGLLQALFGLWAYYADWTMNTSARLYHVGLQRWRPWEDLRLVSPGRITGSLGVASNFFGGLMIVPTVLAVGLFAGVEDRRLQAAAAATAFVGFFALVLSFTRASILGAAVGFLVVVVVTRRIRVVPLVLVLVLAAGLATPIVQRLGVGNNRATLLRTAVELVRGSPLTGVGEFEEGARSSLTPEQLRQVANQRGEVITPHDSFLRAATETGIPGGILLFLAAVLPGVVVLAAAFGDRPERFLLAGIAGALAGFGLQTFSNNLLHIPNVSPSYWLVAAAGVGVAAAWGGRRGAGAESARLGTT